jgi:hypothetical protein
MKAIGQGSEIGSEERRSKQIGPYMVFIAMKVARLENSMA